MLPDIMTRKKLALTTFVLGVNCAALPVFIGTMIGVSDAYHNGVANDGLDMALTGVADIFKENVAMASSITGCALMYIGSRLNR